MSKHDFAGGSARARPKRRPTSGRGWRLCAFVFHGKRWLPVLEGRHLHKFKACNTELPPTARTKGDCVCTVDVAACCRALLGLCAKAAPGLRKPAVGTHMKLAGALGYVVFSDPALEHEETWIATRQELVITRRAGVRPKARATGVYPFNPTLEPHR